MGVCERWCSPGGAPVFGHGPLLTPQPPAAGQLPGLERVLGSAPVRAGLRLGASPTLGREPLFPPPPQPHGTSWKVKTPHPTQTGSPARRDHLCPPTAWLPLALLSPWGSQPGAPPPAPPGLDIHRCQSHVPLGHGAAQNPNLLPCTPSPLAHPVRLSAYLSGEGGRPDPCPGRGSPAQRPGAF